jgi:hypothetical protein
MADFATNLNSMLDEQGLEGGEAAAAPEGEPGGGEAGGEEAPALRRIEGPATEPIDLMEIGGSSVLKRALPIVVALIVLLLILRRRRS